MRKRLLSIFLATIMVLGMFPTMVFAGEEAAAPTGYTTDSHSVMAYKSNISGCAYDYDFVGYVNGKWQTTTSSASKGFKAGTWNQDIRLNLNLSISAAPTFIADGTAIKMEYTVKNTGSEAVSDYRFYLAVDTEFTEDSPCPPITVGSDGSTVTVTENGVSLFTFSTTSGSHSVATSWDWEDETVPVSYQEVIQGKDPSTVTPEPNPNDSAFVMYFDKDTLAAGSTKTYTVIVGLGEASKVSDIIAKAKTEAGGDTTPAAQAKIGTTKYATLAEALTAAAGNTTADTIEIISSEVTAVESATLKAGDSIKTYEGSESDYKGENKAVTDATLSIGEDGFVYILGGEIKVVEGSAVCGGGVIATGNSGVKITNPSESAGDLIIVTVGEDKDTVEVAPACKVKIGDTEYENASSADYGMMTIEVTNDGNKLTEGSVKLDKGEEITVGGKAVKNTGETVTVKANSPEKGKNSVIVPTGGKVEIGGKEYEAGKNEATLVIDADGNVTGGDDSSDDDATTKTIQLGTNGIFGPAAVFAKEGEYYKKPQNYIYFGMNDTTPMKWRVLNNDGKIFLLLESALGGVQFNTEAQGKKYQGSNVQSWLKNTFLKDYFSDADRLAMFGVKKADPVVDVYGKSFGSSNLTTEDKVFIPSAQELAFYVANYSQAPGLSVGKDYWLRSPSTTNNAHVGVVLQNGGVTTYGVWVTDTAVRPATNLDTSKILFTSSKDGKKAWTGNAGQVLSTDSIKAYSGNEWKLTLLDETRDFQINNVTYNDTSFSSGETVAVNDLSQYIFIYWNVQKVGDNNYISAILEDASGNVVSYQKLQISKYPGNNDLGIKLPANLKSGTYTLHVFSEQCNGDYETDYASAFCDITLKVGASAEAKIGTTEYATLAEALTAAAGNTTADIIEIISSEITAVESATLKAGDSIKTYSDEDDGGDTIKAKTDATLSVDKNGDVTFTGGEVEVSEGAAIIGGGVSATGNSGVKITNLATGSDALVSVVAGKDKDTVYVLKNSRVKIGNTEYENASDTSYLVIEVTKDGNKLTGGTGKLDKGAEITVGGKAVKNTGDKTIIVKANAPEGKNSVVVPAGGKATIGGIEYEAGDKEATLVIDADGNVTLTGGAVKLDKGEEITVGGKAIKNTGDKIITVKAGDPEGKNSVVVPAGGKATVGGVEYEAGDKDATLVIDTNGNITLTGGVVKLDKNEEITVGGKAIKNTGDKTITVKANAPEGKNSVVVPAGGKATVGGVEYEAGDKDATLVIDTNGTVTLTGGVVKLDKNEEITVGGKAIKNTGDKTITVKANVPEGKNSVVVPAGGKATVGGVEYEAGDKEATLVIDTAGNVTFADGSLVLDDGESITGGSGKVITNPTGSNNDKVTVTKGDGKDTVTIPAGGKAQIDGKQITGATNKETTVEVDKDGKITVVIPKSGSVTIDGKQIAGDKNKETTVEVDKDGKITVIIPKSGSVTVDGKTYTDTRADSSEGDNIKVVIGSDGNINVVKPTPKTPVAPTISTELTYGQKLSDIKLPDGWTWADGTTVPSVSDSGKTAYSVKIKVDGVNYDWTGIEGYANGYYTTTVKVTVNKATYNMSSVTFDGDTVTYDGKKHSLAISGKLPSGVTVTYTNNGKTESGVYTVIAKFSGDSKNYNAIPDKTATLTIKAKDITGALVELGSGLTYNGSEQTQAVTSVTVDGLAVTYTASGNVGTNAKSYTLTITANGNFTGTVTTDWSIAKAKVTVPVATTGLVYTGLEQTGVADGNLYTVTNGKATGAGNYTATVTLKDTVNYEWAAEFDGKIAWSIAKATYNMSGVTFNGDTVTYDGKKHSLAVGGRLPSGVTVTYTNNGKTESGVYTVIAKFVGDSANYNAIPDKSATLTIKQATIEKVVDSGNENKPDVVISEEGGTDPSEQFVIVKQEKVPTAIQENVQRNEIVYAVYDITLHSDGVSIQPSGELTIKLLIPDDAKGRTFRILHLHGDDVTEVEYTVDGDYAVFTVDKLSEFSIVVDNTGSALWLIILLAIIVAAEIVLIVLKKRKTKGKSSKLYAAGLFGGVIPVAQIVLLAVLGSAAVILGVYAVYLYSSEKETGKA